MNTIGSNNTRVQASSQKSYLTPQNKKVNLINLEALKVSSKILAPFTQELLAPVATQFSKNFSRVLKTIQTKRPDSIVPDDMRVLSLEKRDTWEFIKMLPPEKLTEFQNKIIQLAESGYIEEIQDFIKQNPNNLKFIPEVLSHIIYGYGEDKNLNKKNFDLIKNRKDLNLLEKPLSALVDEGFAKEIFDLIKNREDLNSFKDVLTSLVYKDLGKWVFDLIKNRKDLSQFSKVLSSMVTKNDETAQEILEIVRQQKEVNILPIFLNAYYSSFDSREIQNLIEKYPKETKNIVETCVNYLLTTKNFSRRDFTKLILMTTDYQKKDSVKLNSSFYDVFKTQIIELLKQNPENLHLFPLFLWLSIRDGKAKEVWKLFKTASPNQMESLQKVLNRFIDEGVDTFTKGTIWKFIVDNLDKLESFPATLKCFAFNGYSEQVFELLKQNPNYIEYFQPILLEQRKENPVLFMELIKSNYENCNEDEKILDVLINLIFKNPTLAFQTTNSKKELISNFFKYISRFSDEQAEMFFNCENPLSMFLESPSRLEFEKTGSELSLTHFPNFGTIITNTIPKTSFQVWKNIHDKGDIPVAPILWTENHTDNKIFVHSRYCGITLTNCNNYYQKCGLENIDFDTYSNGLLKLLNARLKAVEIKTAIKNKGVNHGHPHNENFTVEFIDKDYLKKRFELGETINTIEYNPESFSFDPEVYIQNTNKWEIVVRLIDWDQASQVSC